MDGFYEWRREGVAKAAFLFRRRDRRPLAFAGLWDQWQSPDHQLLRSCAIVTCAANAVMAPVHDRMPVILHREGFERWLTPGAASAVEVSTLRELLRPCPEELLEIVPVSPLVNSVKNNGPELMRPLGAAAS